MTPEQESAMRQALDALANLLEAHYQNNVISADCRYAENAIKSLGQAIEQAEKQEVVGWPCVIETADFEEDIVTLKMQSNDYTVGVGLHWLSTTHPQPKAEQPKVRTGECLLTGVCASEGHKIQPKASVPTEHKQEPKRAVAESRKWVGLTDEEIEDCYKQGGIGRACEMLREKNGGRSAP